MAQKMTFETAIARLEEIVNSLEVGDQPLEQSLKLFEEGSSLAALCYQKLATAEQKITDLSKLEEKDGRVHESD
jgi:exodeoxyribonuclease VII small subunit